MLLSAASATQAQTPAFNLNFDTLPSAQGWTFSPYPSTVSEAPFFSVSDGVLHQNTLGQGSLQAVYSLYNYADFSQPYTSTLRARVLAEDRGQNGYGFSVSFQNGTGYTGFGIGTSEIYDISHTTISNSIDTSVYHDYRFDGNPNGTYRFYIDGVFTHAGNGISIPQLNQIYFGDATPTGSNARADIAAFTFSQGSYDWQGGSGNWSDANWTGAGSPNNSTDNVVIDDSNPLNSVVNLNNDVSIGTLGIGAGDALNLQNDHSLTINGGAVTNNGTLSLNGTGDGTYLLLSADTTLAGSGTTVLGNDANNRIDSNSGTVRTLTIGSDQTVEGGGSLGGVYNTLKVVNQGTVLAEHGTMQLNTISVDSTGILAVAADGVLQQNGGSVSAQTINVATGGSYTLSSGRLEANTFNGDFTQSAGTFAAGIGTGPSNLNGNYTLNSGGTLAIDLASYSVGTYDQLDVGGNLLLAGGNLTLLPQAGFSVAQGSVLDLVNVQGSRSGTFSNLAEGASVSLGGSNLNLTYTAGNGNDIALVSALTPGSKNYTAAGTDDVAYVAGTRTAPTGSGLSTTTLKGMDILSGSSYTLGIYETLALDGGNGTLNISQGGVFTGNGVVQGNIHNAGLVRIPITALGQVTGGNVVIPVPQPSNGLPPPPIVSPDPTPINQDTVVSIGNATGGSGSVGSGGGASGGSTGSGLGGSVITIDTSEIDVQGVFAVDASLEVTGSFTQTDTGALRLFVGGNQAADFDVSRTGGSYSQLFVDQAVTLDGALQIVLQPELFSSFSYTPHVGDTFDFVTGLGGITLTSGLQYNFFVTQAGASFFNWLALSPYDSGILGDPDTLYQINQNLFRFDLVNGNKVLRGTLLSSLTGSSPSSPVPEPSILWLFGTGLLGLGFTRFKPSKSRLVGN